MIWHMTQFGQRGAAEGTCDERRGLTLGHVPLLNTDGKSYMGGGGGSLAAPAHHILTWVTLKSQFQGHSYFISSYVRKRKGQINVV